MEQYVEVYEGLADRMNVILSPDNAAQKIREIFECNGWEDDPSEVEPAYTLELIEEDDDGTGLYGAHWQGEGRYREYVWLRPDRRGCIMMRPLAGWTVTPELTTWLTP